MNTLHIEPCSLRMAREAVGRWHYSRNMPGRSRWRYGVYEYDRFVGAVLFDSGANMALAQEFGLVPAGDHPEVLELLRVALDKHCAPTSQIVSVAVRLLRRANPRLRLLVSYADTGYGHHGGIYQAMGWAYTGESSHVHFRIHGQPIHSKSVWRRYGTEALSWLRANVDRAAEREQMPVKHRYVLPFDAELQRRVSMIHLPYPKRAESIDGDAPILPDGNEGGSNPTSALDLFGDAA